MGLHGVIKLKSINFSVNIKNLILSFFIYSNHDIKYLPLKIRTLTIIYYIINYITQGNCNKYQRIMFAVLVEKVYKDAQTKAMTTTTTTIRFIDLTSLLCQLLIN